MPENRFKTMVDEGRCPIQVYLGDSSVLTAELVGRAGYDSVAIDMQHGAVDYKDVYAMLLALSASVSTPMVRIPWNEPGIIGKVIDAGMYGVVCPLVNTRAEAEALVGACRYPPVGYRSLGPLRAGMAGFGDYMSQANDLVMTIAQIETQQAMDNLEEIVATPGLDALYPGPADLSLSCGGPGGIDYRDSEVERRIRRIIDVAHSADVKVGLPVMGNDDIPLVRSWGVDWIQIGLDWLWIAMAANKTLHEARQVISDFGGPDGAAPATGSYYQTDKN